MCLYNTGRKIKNLPVLIFYKEEFVMEEKEEIILTPEMEEELSNGKEEGEE
ncbi:MAG: hypothetical protein U0O04_03580 [Clostridia bacterium]